MVTHVPQDPPSLDVKAEDVIVAVMGMTGAGKSTFIKHLTGRQDIAIGHNLKSCTQELCAFHMNHPDGSGRRLVLIDTQGFDDDTIRDADVLDKIASWMAKTYYHGVKLSGLLFVHKISDNRMGGTALRNLELFKKLVGENSLGNVVLVTTMWGLVDNATGINRERELIEELNYWGGLIQRGAQHAQFQGTTDSAKGIIRLLDGRAPIAVQVQTQIVHERLPVAGTSPGLIITAELDRAHAETQQLVENLKAEHEKALEAGNKRMMEQLERERAEFEKKLAEIQGTTERLKTPKPWYKRFAYGFVQFITFGLVDTSTWE